MRKSKRKYFYLDDFEHRLLVGCLMTARNEYIYEDKPIEDVNELILKMWFSHIAQDIPDTEKTYFFILKSFQLKTGRLFGNLPVYVILFCDRSLP